MYIIPISAIQFEKKGKRKENEIQEVGEKIQYH